MAALMTEAEAALRFVGLVPDCLESVCAKASMSQLRSRVRGSGWLYFTGKLPWEGITSL